MQWGVLQPPRTQHACLFFLFFYSFFNSWHRLGIEHVMFSWMIEFALTKSMFLDSFELARDMLLSTILDSGSLKSPWLFDTYWVPFFVVS